MVFTPQPTVIVEVVVAAAAAAAAAAVEAAAAGSTVSYHIQFMNYKLFSLKISNKGICSYTLSI